MEGKLIKMVDGYTLSLTGSIDDLYGISDKNLAEDHQLQKLSIKNCEAIVNGYDLDELAKSEAIKISETEVRDEKLERIYKRGFLKALEILGDKMFDEEDILIAIEAGYHSGINHNVDEEEQGDKIIRLKDLVIPSLYQTEWDIEIEMECVIGCENLIINGENSLCCGNKKPKLDRDGCLILKRKV